MNFISIMEEVWSEEFAVKAVFHQQIYSNELTFSSLRTIKGRTVCFSTTKSALSSSLGVNFI